MPERRHARVLNVEEVEPMSQAKGGFSNLRRRIGLQAGNVALGCSHYEVPPNKTAFPFHFHSAIEEAIYILEGEGTLRIGTDKIKLRVGDYVAFPPGPESTHALTNDGALPLRYLALSSPSAPHTCDIVAYPDSKKVAYVAGVDPKQGFKSAWLMKIIKDDTPNAGYYDDEPNAE
jgi:uncharacterized cupin superfamily protein